jgi:ornithine decarboxylase
MEPYCLVDVDKITQAYSKWQKWLPEVNIYYAVKCNPHPRILQHMQSLGIKFDCASKKEIEDVLKIAPASSILFAHPVKIPQHIAFAREKSVQTLVFDSISELFKINENHFTCDLLLRLWVKNTPGSPLSKKFGAEMQDVPMLLKTATTLNLNVIGFSFHVGSPCEDPHLYCEALQLCRVACDIAMTHDIHITTIDIGGGFQASNFEACAQQVRRGMHFFKNMRFISEVGRYLVESSHRLYVHVIGKKIKGKRIYYINDGLYGTFSCKMFDHATPLLQTEKEGPLYPSLVYGPTCDSLDIVEEEVWLPDLEIGDVLYVDNYGAYTLASCFNGYEMKTFLYGQF